MISHIVPRCPKLGRCMSWKVLDNFLVLISGQVLLAVAGTEG